MGKNTRISLLGLIFELCFPDKAKIILLSDVSLNVYRGGVLGWVPGADSRACDSQCQGHEFKPHVGCKDHLKKKKK